ncbi:ESX secretion-associated protein EspG, partial [Nocardia farcinica]|uniref:ESX secretion-associated protein EspG n=1 Tax=Nocardia farcinica TaxID=37329 RepID=UPI002454FBA1
PGHAAAGGVQAGARGGGGGGGLTPPARPAPPERAQKGCGGLVGVGPSAPPPDFTAAVYALGVAERDAPRYGLAFESCRAYAEIVAYAHVDGVTTRPPCAAVVYETGRGRIVVAPGIAPDQQVWSTVTPGTDHRVAQAISGLIETLPGGRWLPQ